MGKKFIIVSLVVCVIISFVVFAQDVFIGKRLYTYDIIAKKDFLKKIWYSNLSDESFQKFIGVGHPFSNVEYEPLDLVYLQWLYHISAQTKHQLREEAALKLEELAMDFYEEFWANVVIVSAYRSYWYQKNSISKSCKESWWCAKEWESEHQLWLAVDLWETTNEKNFLVKYQKYYDRLHDNAHKYWFHQSFQNGREIDGYYIEPRHWRYLWVELATKLYENNISFTQYVFNV